MSKIKKISCSLVAALVFSFNAQADDGEVELVDLMSSLQYFSHKLGLAIDNKNPKLADFYAHEMEEVIEQVEEVESYDGFPIGQLVKGKLVPAFEKAEEAVKAKDWAKADKAFDDLVYACNDCHQASDHGYIKLERKKDNPFMQSFSAE